MFARFTSPLLTASVLLAMIAGLLLPQLSVAQEKLVIGTVENNPPFARKNHAGDFEGLDIDLARELCNRNKWECSFKPIIWGNLVPALRNGSIDMIAAGMSVTDERSALVKFGPAHANVSLAMATSKTSLLSGFTAADLVNTKIGVLQSSLEAAYVSVHHPQKSANEFSTREELHLALANGAVGAIIEETTALSGWLKHADGKICCRLVSKLPHDPEITGEGIALAFRNDDARFAIASKTLAALGKNGELAKLQAIYLRLPQ